MIYLYIDEDGRVGKSEDEPTDEDTESVRDGRLEVIRISQDQFGNIFPEHYDPDMNTDDPWYDTPEADVDETEDGKQYHYIGLG